MTFESALKAATTGQEDFVTPYVDDLASVLDLDAVRAAGLKIGVDPLGGAAIHYWEPIAKKFGLNITVVNPKLDPAFGFMTLDHDGKIRMDCSSHYAMAGLVGLKVINMPSTSSARSSGASFEASSVSFLTRSFMVAFLA